MPEPLTGIDIHGGLRVRLESHARTIGAAYSAEPGVDPDADVDRYIARVRQVLDYVVAWRLARALRKDQTAPPAPDPANDPGSHA